MFLLRFLWLLVWLTSKYHGTVLLATQLTTPLEWNLLARVSLLLYLLK